MRHLLLLLRAATLAVAALWLVAAAHPASAEPTPSPGPSPVQTPQVDPTPPESAPGTAPGPSPAADPQPSADAPAAGPGDSTPPETSDNRRGLPVTGAQVGGMVVLGGGLIAAGIAMLAVRRRDLPDFGPADL